MYVSPGYVCVYIHTVESRHAEPVCTTLAKEVSMK
jgi:hypothetical protein